MTPLRVAARGDLDAIGGIELAAFASEHERFGRRQVARMIANPRAHVVVSEVDGTVVGWSAMLVRREGVSLGARLYGIAVRPDAGGRGIGRALAEDAVAWARGRGAVRATLEVRADNTPAIGLYRSLGFVETEPLPGYYGPADGVRMRLAL